MTTIKCAICLSLVLCAAPATFGRTGHDRNISRKRIRMDVTTAAPSNLDTSAARLHSQSEALDRAERQMSVPSPAIRHEHAPDRRLVGLERTRGEVENGDKALRLASAPPQTTKPGRRESRSHAHRSGWITRNGQ
jgi:uncharacterized membrane protein YccC